MLLKCCLLHIDMILPRHAIFCIFVSMSTSRSINYMIFLSLSFSFSLQLITWSHQNATLAYLGFFYQKFSLRVLLSFCLIFCHFQLGLAYKSVAYKKSVYLQILEVSISMFPLNSLINKMFSCLLRQVLIPFGNAKNCSEINTPLGLQKQHWSHLTFSSVLCRPKFFIWNCKRGKEPIIIVSAIKTVFVLFLLFSLIK